MKLLIGIEDRVMLAAVVISVFLLASVSSCFGQALTSSGAKSMHGYKNVTYKEDAPLNKIMNAGNVINVAKNVNVEAKAVPLNASINSPYEELKPAFAPNGDKLYFSRVFHPNNTNGANDPEDIWYSQYDSLDETWSEPIRMPGFLNNAGPNFVNNVSVTGDTLILGNQYFKNGKMHAGLSYSANINGRWSHPTPITIKNDYNISSHANHFVALKTGVIISAIQRVETFGLRDLYVSFWNGEYATEPINMGGIINSDLEESSPYLSCDQRTLYFASKGHNGYGGYDIFMSTRLDDSWTNWTVPQNLGPAVNGPQDDEYFSITHCGRYGIFAKRVSVNNIDLFKIPTVDLFGREAPSDLPKTQRKPRMTMGGI